MLKRLILLVLIACSSGCAALYHRANYEGCPYIGTRFDWGVLTEDSPRLGFVPFLVIDLPLSAVVDTVFLPFELLSKCER
ncbi:YceK/YidQ family lipoprotein [Pseudomonas sp. 10S4]|uniref:YceK/YidQ family lipoprotein n=1 Tax=Pseudomonas sp. 10S4 TaxID=3048583 RepID=UPI002AC8BF1A|nr:MULTISPECIES: YceK/YidQ family lipoprotein [unclassified Pseudomonas]MEB0226288.1 YceK/YidQ family lipoprotein [Pseudomonas sp. 5S1]MEB0294891.1 YceK/YidQ family lipoprotein [Pseudomonas sp. 10S4]WPX18162.1 YceK/YidQ family lipoprotein [Pseudomonas sp. 10S4]